MIGFKLSFVCALTILTTSMGRPLADRSSDPVELGDGTVTGSFIRPYRTEWAMFEEDEDGNRRETGRWTDEVQIVDQDGSRVLKRSQATYDSDGTWQSSQFHTIEVASFAPIRSHYTSRRGGSHTEYQGAEARGVMLPHPDQEPIIYSGKVDRPVFDFNLAGLFLAAFPLEEGYTASFPYFDLHPTFAEGGRLMSGVDLRVSEGSFEVTGRETVSAGDKGDMEAFIVESRQGGYQLKFWLSKASPYVLRLESTNRGRKTIWLMKTSR